MTQTNDKNLKTLLEQSPLALAALERSLERQQATRQARGKPKVAPVVSCPFCGEGGKVLTVGKGEAARSFTVMPDTCCQQATKETALRALRYSMNPLGDKKERLEQGLLFAELRQKITLPSLLAELAEEQKKLEAAKGHVLDTGRSFGEPSAPVKRNLSLH